MSLGIYLLAKIIREERLPDFLRLRQQLFQGDAEEKTFTYIQNHVDRYHSLPSIELVRADLARQQVNFQEPPTNDSFAVYHDRVISRAVRGLINTMTGQLADLEERDADVRESLDAVARFSENLSTVRTESQRELVQMADLGDVILEEMGRSRTQGGVTGIPTGWHTLDLATRGLQPGDIYVVLARPKMGKTLVMLRIADAAHRAGYTPLLISMEMRQEQMARRHFAMRTGVNMTLLQRGQLSTFAEELIREKVSEMRSQTRYHFVEGQFKSDVQDVEGMVKSLRPHLVLVDAGYLLKMRRSTARQRWELITDIAAALKNIATTCMVPLVVSFQFNREVRRGAATADMANIQLADAIGQLASVAIGLFEPRDSESVAAGRRRLIKVIGGREGEGDIEDFEIEWDWRRMNFDEISEPDYQREVIDSPEESVEDL